MTCFFVEVANEPDILAAIRTGRIGLDWTVISEQRVGDPSRPANRNWLFEIQDPDAPASVEGMVVCPQMGRYADGSVFVSQWHPTPDPRLESRTA